jgi:hypothetical protein
VLARCVRRGHDCHDAGPSRRTLAYPPSPPPGEMPPTLPCTTPSCCPPSPSPPVSDKSFDDDAHHHHHHNHEHEHDEDAMVVVERAALAGSKDIMAEPSWDDLVARLVEGDPLFQGECECPRPKGSWEPWEWTTSPAMEAPQQEEEEQVMFIGTWRVPVQRSCSPSVLVPVPQGPQWQ